MFSEDEGGGQRSFRNGHQSSSASEEEEERHMRYAIMLTRKNEKGFSVVCMRVAQHFKIVRFGLFPQKGGLFGRERWPTKLGTDHALPNLHWT